MAVSEDAGKPTSLHSRFDPDKEARRFLDREVETERLSTALIVAPGMNFLGRAVRERWPSAKLVSLFCSRETYEASVAGRELAWHPELQAEPATFLRRVLREEDVLHLRLLVWPPAKRRYPDLAARLLDLAAGEVSHLSSGFATVAASGRRWVRNAAFHRAILPTEEEAVVRRGQHSVVIAASGPSLEDSLEAIRRRRQEIELWALPSALLPLGTRGIVPDLVVTSDPGFYARAHLRSACLQSVNCTAPITASRNLGRLKGPLALFSNGTALEASLMDLSSLPYVGENGSVAGLALDFALLLERDPIVFVGLDGCTEDSRSHAGPSGLDPFVVSGTGRFFPTEQARLERVIEMPRLGGPAPVPRVSTALGEYAAWFRHRCQGFPRRVFRINPTVVDYGIPEIEIDAVPGIPESIRQLPVVEKRVPSGGGEAGTPATGEPSPGIHKLVGILGSLQGEKLSALLTDERSRRLAGLPRSNQGDLLFLSATRSYANALSEPTPEKMALIEERLRDLLKHLRRYKETAKL